MLNEVQIFLGTQLYALCGAGLFCGFAFHLWKRGRLPLLERVPQAVMQWSLLITGALTGYLMFGGNLMGPLVGPHYHTQLFYLAAAVFVLALVHFAVPWKWSISISGLLLAWSAGFLISGFGFHGVYWTISEERL